MTRRRSPILCRAAVRRIHAFGSRFHSLPSPSTLARSRHRTALVSSADSSFRQRLTQTLSGLRWQVREADGGAQAWAEAETSAPEALIVDSWLPDLDLDEFLKDFRGISAGGPGGCRRRVRQESPRGPYRQELLYALRRCQDTDSASWNLAPPLTQSKAADGRYPRPPRGLFHPFSLPAWPLSNAPRYP